MVLTNDEQLCKRLKLFRTHGITREEADLEHGKNRRDSGNYMGPWYYEQTELGYNYRITDIQCALGISQMNRLEEFVEKRKKLAERYHEAFSECEDIVTPKQLAGTDSSWHLYVIQILNHDRREIFEKMREAGIGVNVHYIPVYTFPYYQAHGYQDVCCEHAEELYRHIISLPLYPDLKEEEQDYVIKTLKGLLR